MISVVSYVPHTRSIITCDPEAIKFIVAERKKFMKPLGMYAPLAMYGPNVGVSEGAEWVRHKRIVASSNLLEVSILGRDTFCKQANTFAYQNINQLAWENTMKTMDLCFDDWQNKMRQSGTREVKVDSVVQLTLKVGQMDAVSQLILITCAASPAGPVRHSWSRILAIARVGGRFKSFNTRWS